MIVELIDGPAAGAKIDVSWGATLVIEGEGVPDGAVARYRPTRRRADATYRFKEWDRIVARLPLPGSEVKVNG